ncbi:MAG: hypothetical protein AAGH79_06965 [Bacteroidota bacterium]
MKHSLLLFVFACWATLAAGQTIQKGLILGDSTQLHTLVTRNFQSIKGTVLNIESEIITFQLNSGQVITFFREEVSRVYFTDRDAIARSKQSPGIKNSQQVIIAPSSLPRAKGDHTYRNFLLFYNEWSRSIHDHWDIDLSIFPAIAFNMAGVRVRYATSLTDNFHINGHTDTRIFFGTILDFRAYQFAGAGFTIGKAKTHFNLNGSYALGLTPAEDNAFVLTFSGRAMTGKRWGFHLEVINAPTEADFTNFVFLGSTYYGRNGRFDFGIMNPAPQFETSIILPYFGFTFFSKKRKKKR